MPTIAEDSDISTNASIAPIENLVPEVNTKTDMAHFAQLLRRSLSIADAGVEAANQADSSNTRRDATGPIVRIPTPSPRPAFVLVSAPTQDQTNTKTHNTSAMVSGPHLNPGAAPTSCSQEASASHQNHDLRDRPRQEQSIDLQEALRLLETKEILYKGLEAQITEVKSDISSVKNLVQNMFKLLNQGQAIPSAAVANQFSPNASMTGAHNHAPIVDNAIPSGNKNKKERKKKTGVPTFVIAANANANKGKKKKLVHSTVASVDAGPSRTMTRAEGKERKAARKERKAARKERKAVRKAARKTAAEQQQVEEKLEQEAMKKLPLGLAPVRLSYPWLLGGRWSCRRFSKPVNSPGKSTLGR